MVITKLDYREITRTLLYCIAIPVPIFTLAICYLVFAYNYIYTEDEEEEQVSLPSIVFLIMLFNIFCWSENLLCQK